ncbi:Trk system potassium transporter TrkA [Candidatus Margulisiibacteriota bacterium]
MLFLFVQGYNMKIVIIGAGSIGFQLAKQLITEKKDVIIIEQNPRRAKQAINQVDCLVINKDGSQAQTLKEAHIETADYLVCVTDSDEVNIVACNFAEQLNPKICKIARINNTKYLKNNPQKQVFPCIDYIINPEEEVSKVITNTLIHGASNGVFIFKNHNIQSLNITVEKSSYFNNKSLKEIKSNIQENFIIGSIFRDRKIIIPLGDTKIQEGDQICLFTPKNISDSFMKKIGLSKKDFKKIVIVGGSKVGCFVAEELTKMERSIKIIDKDYEKCKELSEQFPEAIVINGDISDESIFDEEQLNATDLIITTTKNQELNILTSIYAKHQGVKHAIALTSNSNYGPMANELGLDFCINIKKSSVNRILTFLRKGNVKNIYSIFDGTAEVIESTIEGSQSVCNKPIRKIKLPKDTIILAVNRNNQDYIPDGNFVINPNDHVITLAKSDSVTKIEELFTK